MKSGIMDKYWSNDDQKWDKSYPKAGQKVVKNGSKIPQKNAGDVLLGTPYQVRINVLWPGLKKRVR